MNIFRKTAWLLLILLLLVSLRTHEAKSVPPAQAKVISPRDESTQPIRIGVPYYDDRDKTYSKYLKLFSDQLKTNKTPLYFKIAVGTYDEVLSWYKDDLVDLAVLPPGAISDLLTSAPDMDKKLQSLYIGTQSLEADGTEVFMGDDQKAKGKRRLRYRAVCVVRKDSHISNFEQLKNLAGSGNLKLLFVHPLSVSGRVLPEYLLRTNTDNFDANVIEWTYNHKLSLDMLLNEQDKGKVKAAFIWDALQLDKEKEKATAAEIDKTLNFFELPSEDIPQDILFSTSSFNHRYPELRKQVEELLRVNEPDHDFEKLPDWLKEYSPLNTWVSKVKEHLPPTQRNSLVTYNISLDQIISRLRNYADAHRDKNQPLRLAVVLSGGGAKCAYQLGALEALEAQLEAVRNSNQEKYKDIDISLVVGTSGGSINALAAALQLTRDEDGRQKLRATWGSFDQGEFFQPWRLMHFIFGVSFGIAQVTFFICIVLLIGRWGEHWWKISVVLLFSFCVLEFLLSYSSWTPWMLIGGLGKNHFLHHLWLLGTFSIGWAALCLFFAGAALWLSGWASSSRNIDTQKYSRWLVFGLLLALTLSTGTLIGISLFQVSVLSDSSGFEKALVAKFSGLLREKGIDPEEVNRAKYPFRQISTDIFKKSLLKRDLIITTSSLPAGDTDDPPKELPSDLYFYYTKDSEALTPDKGVPPDLRFISLDENRDYLFDAVIGSSSIFPLFEPRRLERFKRESDKYPYNLHLIDGGFIHNSPIEAAVKWGATHIIVIEASPFEPPSLQNDLLDNSFAAFNYLFSQAQSLDARMYGQREIFLLRPQPTKEGEEPNLDTFDFAQDLIEGAIDKGLNDALNEKEPAFVREPGPPFQ